MTGPDPEPDSPDLTKHIYFRKDFKTPKNLTQQLDVFIVLKQGTGLPPLRIHPYQLQQFVDFEASLQKNKGCDGIPLGYAEWAQEFNKFCVGWKQAVRFME